MQMPPMNAMASLKMLLLVLAVSSVLGGCAVQTSPINQKEATIPLSVQKQAQLAVAAQRTAAPMLKRKIALGRISNETNYGKSFLRDQHDDLLGKQVTDMLSKGLTESGAYLVFERPDIGQLQDESKLTDTKLQLIGVDQLIIGSLTEFGRKIVGETGFISSSKRQVAFAKVDLRVVDVRTGRILFTSSGAGESSTETASTFGFGSQAAYDGTLNDSAIRHAVGDAVNRLSRALNSLPWQTSILKVDNARLYIGGGKSQGIQPGMQFSVQTLGEKILSPQSGADIILPGVELATIRIDANFGDDELSEGSVASIVSGSLGSYAVDQLVVRISERISG